jgi:hypothetical protein
MPRLKIKILKKSKCHGHKPVGIYERYIAKPAIRY